MRAPELVYGYAAGQTKVLEAEFVDAARISRLIDCADLAEMRQVLSETAYRRLLSSTNTVVEIEIALNMRIAQAYRLAEGPDIPPQLGAYFRYKHDFDNLRVLLKSGFGRELDVVLSSLGCVPPGEAQTYAKARSFGGFPAPLKSAAYAAVEAYEKAGDLGVIDIELDRRYFQSLTGLGSELGSNWIMGYTRLQIAAANGRALTRGSDHPLLPAGSLAQTELFKWSGHIRELVDRRPPLDEYDRLADGLASSYLASARLLPVGPEAVFAFIAMVELEVKLLRTVMIARLSGFDPAKLKKRARESN